MSSLSRELVFLILQFLDEDKFKETVHKLEKESGFYFNMRYFEDCVNNGDWDEVEKYLSGFTKVDDNRYSMKIFFEIRKQKYLEALDKRETAKAVEVLVKDLKVFASFNEDLFKEITMLLTLGNFRENEQLSKYEDTKSARGIMLLELKKLIEANPLFRDKLQFPNFKNSRLRTLINQSLNWQHQSCKNPKPNPDIRTLFVDHTCGQPNGACAPSLITNPLMGSVAKASGFPPLGAHGPFQAAPAPITASLAGWMANPSTVTHQTVSVGPMGLAAGNAASILKRPRTPSANNLAMDYQTADSEHAFKRARPFGVSEEGNNLPMTVLPVPFPAQSYARPLYSSDELPKNVVINLNQGYAVKSLDFHPVQPTLLLAGTNIGEITIWEIACKERLVSRNFKIWDLGKCSTTLKSTLFNEYTAWVNRVIWSPDGALFGVAYSKHVVHIYSYYGGDDLRNHIEIDAHVGSVNDLAFSHPNKQLCIITCGDDKTIKVWDAATGNKMYTFEGHEAPVYSVCPHQKENIQFVFSTAFDGKIMAWLYDNVGSRVDYDAPGHSCTKMAYSADGKRLFSCGTNKDGESYIVEWNESEGAVKRTYHGVGKRSVGVVQFDTTKNRFLAAGDEFQIKFWDMDHVNILTDTDAEGGLPASPCIRFNKDGTLLAVSTSENGIKVLANADGIQLLRSIEIRAFDASRGASAVAKGANVGTLGASSSAAGTNNGAVEKNVPITTTVELNGDSHLSSVKTRTDDEVERPKIWKLTDVNESSQLRSLRLPDSLLSSKVIRLIYTNSGGSILALTGSGLHKLWKWRNERSVSAKATTTVSPQLWQPPSGTLMTNDVGDIIVDNLVPCFALSKNDSYVMSTSGGKISLFNMMTFKTMTTFMPPPPAATYLAFHPQDNNIIAMGMEDSSIHIYNVRIDEVNTKLKGHQKQVTGLAFSNVLNVLVSSGSDAQLCVWSMDGWQKQANKLLQIPATQAPNPVAHTRVQFHQDQIHLLVVHETQLAIYEAPKLECIKQCVSQESGLITDATYSCGSHSIFACFNDASVCIFTATLQLRCRISPAAYLHSVTSNKAYPLVIAAHPSEENQFALGLIDGAVHVLEPSESEDQWGTTPPVDNSTRSGSNSASGTDQPPR